MNVNITVKLGQIIPEEVFELLDPQIVQDVLEAMAASARNHWIKLAGERLTSTRQDYIAGLQDVEMSNGQAVLSLLGVMPNLIENGMEQTDLHNTLLGPNVPVVPRGQKGKHRRKGGGFYRYIPFRHAGPTSLGLTGAPMGSQFVDMLGEEMAKKLGRQVHKAAKQLTPTTTEPDGSTKWGGRLPGGMAPKLKPHHKADIFQGMVRLEKTYKKATQSQYMTWRTISTGSPGWIRPKTDGVHIAKDVEDFVVKLAPIAFAAYVNGATGTP